MWSRWVWVNRCPISIGVGRTRLDAERPYTVPASKWSTADAVTLQAGGVAQLARIFGTGARNRTSQPKNRTFDLAKGMFPVALGSRSPRCQPLASPTWRMFQTAHAGLRLAYAYNRRFLASACRLLRNSPVVRVPVPCSRSKLPQWNSKNQVAPVLRASAANARSQVRHRAGG